MCLYSRSDNVTLCLQAETVLSQSLRDLNDTLTIFELPLAAALFLGIDLMVNIEKVNAMLLKSGYASVTPCEWLFIETMNQADLSLAFIVQWVVSKRDEATDHHADLSWCDKG
ncbi:hypothetical protein [Vibrio campbellii]|uniref:hypothetical protein n=2 Tax=Vibrio TaxID=662 RepID=UPI0005768E93|nr:hypothetical protein [Vibrio campbellii]KIP73679.1 hypothetical protein SN11_14500 [Vibrio harveyi]HBC3421583.1 hypothetical protein [Vibrio parahaemolyticus]ARR10369.1 unknow [Vibrio campbellii]HBC3883337.1 hypothetical protein [Vibrio parahaemolyticus]HBC3907645.1 hypothetical protein [Vibrio parahaemolyticus]